MSSFSELMEKSSLIDFTYRGETLQGSFIVNIEDFIGATIEGNLEAHKVLRLTCSSQIYTADEVAKIGLLLLKAAKDIK